MPIKYYPFKLISVKEVSHKLKTVSLKSLRAVLDSGQCHSELSRTFMSLTAVLDKTDEFFSLSEP